MLEDKEESDGDGRCSKMRADIARVIDQATREAVFVAGTPAMDDFFEDQIPKITKSRSKVSAPRMGTASL